MKLNELKIRPLSLPVYLAVAITSFAFVGVAQGGEKPKPSITETKMKNKEQAKPITKKPPQSYSKKETIQLVSEDLAKRLDIDIKEITVLRASQVTWRSGALGCPKPGEMYTQALVPGVLVVLGAQGKHFRYHGKRQGLPVFCPSQFAESPAPISNDI